MAYPTQFGRILHRRQCTPPQTHLNFSMKFIRIDPRSLNSRQKENYYYHKVSAVLADYGYSTIRLNDDWGGADFIAVHINGAHLLVQQKGRLVCDTKYKGKDIWICFPSGDQWYLYPHDDFLKFCLETANIGNTASWSNSDNWDTVQGIYTWPAPPRWAVQWLIARGYSL
jgi:hypothetical protein